MLSSYTSLRNSYQALGLLKSKQISVERLISHRLPLEELQRGIELIEKGCEPVYKVMILPNG
jgi:threonine dehydrogenase-like Zn-dependent dehydrogenase